uniref:Uncharacterized protein n=1 Tax=Rhizophora mucronata TaxID=61149 RepID=A0A2P2IVU2_RHIMU
MNSNFYRRKYLQGY